MDVGFKDPRLKEELHNDRRRKKSWGKSADKLKQRLDEMRASATLAVLRTLPGPRCEELKGDRDGQLSVRALGGLRIVFVPAHDPPPAKSDGGLDWTRVTAVTVIAVEDYHG